MLLVPSALGQAGKTRPPKPDLHAGGAKPSLIPNHEVTTVMLPGFHFTGAQVTVRGACRLEAFQVVSDNEIQMRLEGARSIDDKEDGCFYTVRTPAGSASSYVVVSLTKEEEKEKAAREEAAGRARLDAMIHAAGRKWTLHFADGTTETYTAKPAQGPEPPPFVATDGHSATILVQPDSHVFFMEGRCVRGGRLVNGQVKNGESLPGCPHPGAWTAAVEP